METIIKIFDKVIDVTLGVVMLGLIVMGCGEHESGSILPNVICWLGVAIIGRVLFRLGVFDDDEPNEEA